MSSILGPANVVSGDKLGMYSASVFVSNEWASGWTLVPYLHPIGWTMDVAPAISKAAFVYDYGIASREGLYSKQLWQPLDIGNKFVRIQIASEFGVDEIWQGFVPDTALQMDGDPINASGQQTITAYGLEFLLAREKITTSWIQVDRRQSGPDVVRQTDIVPPFNGALRRGQSSTITGNRATNKITVGTREFFPFFYSNIDATAEWSGLDAIETIMNVYGHEDDIGVPIDIGGQTDLLELFRLAYSIGDMSVWEAIASIASRSRGVAASIRPSWPAPPTLWFSAAIAESFTVGGTTFPGNPELFNVNFNTSLDLDRTTLLMSTQNRYRKAIVKGEPMVTVFSGKVGEAFGSGEAFAPGWEDDPADDYKAIDGAGVTRFDRMEDADYQRSLQEQKFSRVFGYWVLDPFFGGMVDGVSAFPPSLPDGTFDFDEVFWPVNSSQGFSRLLPWKNSPEFDDKSSMSDFRRPFGVLLDPLTSKYRYLHNMHDGLIPNFGLRFADDEFGIEIPNASNWIAKNHWLEIPSRETQDKTLVYPEFNDTDMEFTVAYRSDQRLRVEVDISGNPNDQVLHLNVPNANYWAMLPDTVIDIDEAGQPVRSDELTILKDDSDIVWKTAAFAQVWYSVRRNLTRYRLRGLYPHLPIGAMIGVGYTGAYYADINTIVTKKTYSFSNDPTMTISTGYYNVDVVGLARGTRTGEINRVTTDTGVPTSPSQSVVLRRIDGQTAEIKLIQEQTKNTPVHYGSQTGGGNKHLHNNIMTQALVIPDVFPYQNEDVTMFSNTDGSFVKPLGMHPNTNDQLWNANRGKWS